MRYIILITCIVNIHVLTGQNLNYGFTVGIHKADIYGKLARQNKLDWSLHVPVRWTKNRFFTQISTGWVSKGTKEQYFNPQLNKTEQDIFRLEYLEVPVNIGYHFIRRDKLKVYVFSGFAYSFLLFGNREQLQDNVAINKIQLPQDKVTFFVFSPSTSAQVELSIRRHEYSAFGGFGTDFKLKKRLFFVEILYNRAISGLYPEPADIYWNHYYGIRLGTFFGQENKEK